ncbi:MAG: hypothetical protein ABL308_06965 [Oceanicaulis sp.]
MESTDLMALAAALVFAGVHLVSPWLMFLDVTPRSAWLSISGGVATAYVFLHLLPELAGAQADHLGGAAGLPGARDVWLMAMAGLSLSYAFERMARVNPTGRGAPWSIYGLHLGSFAVYNALIGYVIDEQARRGLVSLALYTFALGLHYVVNDRALVRKHGDRYRRSGRFILAAAPIAGWALGAFVFVEHRYVALLTALLAGGIILNTVKEELPKERESNVWAFLGGVAAYGALLLVV